MIVVAHRRNTLAQLAATPRSQGIEMDVRVRGDRLVVAHDPFEDGVELDVWLDAYDHALLVVNAKEEGLVAHILPRLLSRGIGAFFFLGPPLPEALAYLRAGEPRFSVRVSEVHHPGTALGLAGSVDWVWLDGFDGFPVDDEVLVGLHRAGLKICLVSPELYGRPAAQIAAYQRRLATCGVAVDAVCTRHPEAWATAP